MVRQTDRLLFHVLPLFLISSRLVHLQMAVSALQITCLSFCFADCVAAPSPLTLGEITACAGSLCGCQSQEAAVPGFTGPTQHTD